MVRRILLHLLDEDDDGGSGGVTVTAKFLIRFCAIEEEEVASAGEKLLKLDGQTEIHLITVHHAMLTTMMMMMMVVVVVVVCGWRMRRIFTAFHAGH